MIVEREIIELEEMHIIYGKKPNSEDLEKALENNLEGLFSHILERGLFEKGENKILTIYRDIEDREKLPILGITTPTLGESSEDIGSLTISGTYLVGHFKILKEEFKDAWQEMYRLVVEEEKLSLRDSYPFEIYRSNPSQTGPVEVDIYIPI